MPTRNRKPNKIWNRDELESIIKMWKNHSVKEIATALVVTEVQLNRMVKLMRQQGAKLRKKRDVGYLKTLISDVVKRHG